MPTPAISKYSRVGIGPTASVPTRRIVHNSCSFGKTGSITRSQGMRGILDDMAADARDGSNTYGGNLEWNPRADEIADLLGFLLGGTPAAPNYPLGDTITPKAFTVDKVQDIFRYDGCVPVEFKMSGSEGNLLLCTLSVLGTGQVKGVTFPALTLSTQPVFIFYDAGTITIGGVARDFKSWDMTVRYRVETQYFGSQDPTRINVLGREIMVNVTLPYDDENDDLDNVGAAGLSGSVAFTVPAGVTGGTSLALTFAWPKLQIPARGVDVPNSTEEMITIEAQAVKPDLATAAMTTTLDSTV